MPVVRGSVSRINAKCFHGIDELENPLDLRPPGQAQQDDRARVDARNSGIALFG